MKTESTESTALDISEVNSEIRVDSVSKKSGNWLPDMDLNHDKQIQSLLCYRYTIGQAGAFRRLNSFSTQSSRQTTRI